MKETTQLARGLGWFSIGLGLLEVGNSLGMVRFLGPGKLRPLVQLYGVRELAAGVGILAERRPSAFWLWARVAGDALDITSLAGALGSKFAKKGNVFFALGAVLGVTALDVLCAVRLQQDSEELFD